MPLKVVKGPPNSGRTEEIRRRYLELLSRRPLLVVPGVDDIFGWERRLTEGTGAMVGGQIVHFKDLYEEVLELDKERRPASATELQRIQLMREAIRSEWKDVAARLPDQPGLVDSVLRLVDDLRAESVTPETLESRIEEAGLGHLDRLTAVYRRYLDLLVVEAGLTDGPREAERAVERVVEVWGARPVLIAGFDELTRQQLEMVRRLAFVIGVEVTVAVTHEPDNPALALTDQLVSDLLDLGPEDQVSVKTTRREDETPPHDDLLLEVEKRFMRPRRESDRPLPATEALTVLESAGQRNEAEAIAAEISKLIAADVPADQIAVAIEAPAQNGRIIRDTLERFRIPVTLEAETRVGATVTGRALLDLLAAAGPADSATGLLAYLRSPIGPDPELVDLLEREMRIRGIESATAAIELLTGPLEGEPPPLWEELTSALRDGEPILELVAAGASRISLAILAADEGEVPSASTVVEAQAGSAIGRACREIERFRGAGKGAADVAAALESEAVKVWEVPASGTVRIASPYSLRAKRMGYLFCAGLQESGLSDTDRAGPFLSVKDRASLRLSPHRDPEVQQRYLFYSSITVPTRRLWLSCRTSDETGKAEHPSPLIGAVEELFAKDEQGRPIVSRGGRSGSEITFQPADAPTPDELARSLAPLEGGPARHLAAAGLEGELAEALASRLDRAEEVELRTRRLESLTLEPILAALGEAAVFGATELEAYAGCPYRWFIERQLDPQPFEPDPDYLTVGTLLHETLEELYRAHPGEIPRPETVDVWLDEVPVLVNRKARSRRIGLGTDSVSHAALRSRATQLISAHLRREAGWEAPRHLPAELEAVFGHGDSEIPPVDMGGWSLKGKIDRVDLSPDTPTGVPREAVVVDYKSGSLDRLSQKKARKERKLQVQLYLHAVREIWGATPVAGIYVPLQAGGGASRGAYSEAVLDEMRDRGVSKEDRLEDLDGFVAEGKEMADAAVIGIMRGLLDHDPATCPDHFDHSAVPDRPGPADEETAGAGAR